MAAPDLEICNLALAQVPCAPITSVNENGLAARELRRCYGPALEMLLKRSDWWWARGRVTLAAVANDRGSEWQYAYKLPANRAAIRSIRPDYLVPDAGLTVLPGQIIAGAFANGYADTYLAGLPLFPIDGYVLEGDTLYCNLSSCVMVYTRNDVEPASFSPGFQWALAFDIAARVVMPTMKTRERQGELIKLARSQYLTAVADDGGEEAKTRGNDFLPHDARARLLGV
jgi:hypothetical protein